MFLRSDLWVSNKHEMWNMNTRNNSNRAGEVIKIVPFQRASALFLGISQAFYKLDQTLEIAPHLWRDVWDVVLVGCGRIFSKQLRKERPIDTYAFTGPVLDRLKCSAM